MESEGDLCLIRRHVFIMFTVVEVQHHAFLNGTTGKSKHIVTPFNYLTVKNALFIYLCNENTKLTLQFRCHIQYRD